MSGIYDRIGTDDNIPVHLAHSLLVAYAEGDVTRAKALSILNAQIETPLDAASVTDLGVLADSIDAALGVAAKLRELANQHAYMMLKEMGIAEVTETVFRNRLGL